MQVLWPADLLEIEFFYVMIKKFLIVSELNIRQSKYDLILVCVRTIMANIWSYTMSMTIIAFTACAGKPEAYKLDQKFMRHQHLVTNKRVISVDDGIVNLDSNPGSQTKGRELLYTQLLDDLAAPEDDSLAREGLKWYQPDRKDSGGVTSRWRQRKRHVPVEHTW